MADLDQEDQYKQEFIERVRDARARTGMKQWQVAKGMGIDQDVYKHYETRGAKGRLMPHRLMASFCIVCRVNLEWLITGLGKRAWQPLEVVETEPQPKPVAKKRRGRRAA